MNSLVRSQAEYEAVFERITRLALEYLATIPERPSFPDVTGAQTQSWFAHELPEQGLGERALDDLTKVIGACRPNSPRFFGYVFGSGEPVSAAADLLASVLESEHDGMALGTIGSNDRAGCRRLAGGGDRLQGVCWQPDWRRLSGEPDGAGDGARVAASGQ